MLATEIASARETAPPICKGFPVILPGSGGAPQIARIVDGDRRQVVLRSWDEEVSSVHYVHAFDHLGNEMPGWPLTEASPGDPMNALLEPVAAVDLDPRFPGEEIVVSCASGNPETYCRPSAFHGDGSAVPGWPPAETIEVTAGLGTTAVIVPLPGMWLGSRIAVLLSRLSSMLSPDATKTAYLHLLDAAGVLVPGWPRTVTRTGLFYYSDAAIADIDRDGAPEIIVAMDGVGVEAIRLDGSTAAGWPVSYGAEMPSAPVAGDLDGDGQPEVVFIQDGQVWVLTGDGTVAPGFPVFIPLPVWYFPIVADLDGDATLEILAGMFNPSDSGSGGVAVWRRDGSAYPGAPFMADGGVFAPPVVADLDGDGRAEIAVGTYNTSAAVFHSDGTLYAGFPQRLLPGRGITGVLYGPAVGDIDADGDVELLMTTVNNIGFTEETRLHCWDFPGADGTGQGSWRAHRGDAWNRATVVAPLVPSLPRPSGGVILLLSAGVMLGIAGRSRKWSGRR
ncbi:MAG: VCBS repeat-containing protein [Candidatus Schekmanbacteria bacterium]|nr:VCBS repeat-containing protein [Candidatus Schekmanbacteria bacterium]